MKLNKTNVNNAFDGLDGSLLEVGNRESIKTENINDYFLGFIGVGLGLASALYGLLGYADFSPYRLTTGSWVFLVMGFISLLIGSIFAFKATVFALTLKKFLQNAKFTRCNIKTLVKTEFHRDGGTRDALSISLYTVKIYYLDDGGKKCARTIKGLLASKYFQKFRWMLKPEPPYFSLNDCIVAYNKKGKALLLD